MIERTSKRRIRVQKNGKVPRLTSLPVGGRKVGKGRQRRRGQR